MITNPPITDHDILFTAVEAATCAPSIHNTQPWRFALHADTLDVFADEKRWLPATDINGRELTISCGAAVYFARLALRGLSREVAVSLLPDPADPNHLARITMTGRRAPTDAERALIRAIPIRYTDRGVYEERPVPEGFVNELRDGVAAEGAWLRPIESADDTVATAVLLAHADDVQQTDPRYVAELIRWSRYDRSASDGIPRQAVSSTPVSDRTSTYRLRDFDVDGRATAHREAGAEPPPAEHPFVCVLGTPGDDRRAWLEAGAALGWLLLRAAAEGISAQPMTQPLEIATTRGQLTHALGLLGHPQMLLRMGYGTGVPTTHRRPPETVIDLG